jgi:alkanesulfonate monooxygenase SsuD/methylene tetrahydromethanopterin reductase-like flavin-dependent oxidoreductase (luciferase family)
MDIGVASLTELVTTTADGRTVTARERTADLVLIAEHAEAVGLDGFAVGEHHSPDFVVSSPAVLLAAVAARTSRIRLGTAVTVLGALDPVRLFEDFATLDLLSDGRAEITVGRGAFPEPFALFGVDMRDYDVAFEEKLELLLQLNRDEQITWRGRTRPPLTGALIAPRPVQDALPIWVGVAGTPASAQRAGRLGLPLMIGSLGMPIEQAAQLADVYRTAGQAHPDRLRLGIGAHLHITGDDTEARGLYPYYRDFLGPKHPGGSGLRVTPDFFEAGFHPRATRYIGGAAEIGDKLAALYAATRFDRFQALVGWGGQPLSLTRRSLDRFAADVVPPLRALADD